MELMKAINGAVTEASVREYRYNVVLKTKVGGFKLYLETNVTAVSRNDAIQTVSGLLDKAKAEFDGVLKQQWQVHTLTPIKPAQKTQHQQRPVAKNT